MSPRVTHEDVDAATSAANGLVAALKTFLPPMTLVHLDPNDVLRETKQPWRLYPVANDDRGVRPMYAHAATALEDLGTWLSLVRARRGMALRAVSAETGVALQTLSRLERGGVNVGVTTAVKILRWLEFGDDE